MFLGLPFGLDSDMQHLVLVLNTVLLIAILILMEVLYADAPAAKRREMRLFLPLVFVVVGILLYAVMNQVGGDL